MGVATEVKVRLTLHLTRSVQSGQRGVETRGYFVGHLSSACFCPGPARVHESQTYRFQQPAYLTVSHTPYRRSEVDACLGLWLLESRSYGEHLASSSRPIVAPKVHQMRMHYLAYVAGGSCHHVSLAGGASLAPAPPIQTWDFRWEVPPPCYQQAAYVGRHRKMLPWPAGLAHNMEPNILDDAR